MRNMVSGQSPIFPIMPRVDRYMEPTLGRSLRSIVMLTNNSFMIVTVPPTSKLSRAITRHKWQAVHQTNKSIGLSPLFGARKVASP